MNDNGAEFQYSFDPDTRRCHFQLKGVSGASNQTIDLYIFQCLELLDGHGKEMKVKISTSGTHLNGQVELNVTQSTIEVRSSLKGNGHFELFLNAF